MPQAIDLDWLRQKLTQADLERKILTVALNLADDPSYPREEAIAELLKICESMHEVDQYYRPR
ncbi:hypothetical protein J2S00_003042 [Caldalkalibacillus uzonensis]|uniref:Uncharacterized protein n=1 Tax=Caldalkalibacillus uzonensis TaxID=353224 RepID=A0ABU0CV01_9BACI|nr:hypothetical protein [Caldalkalibacillus uzonensis]MDQ0340237.1 hypothetical protein [Caldalkalibacillus uzonensis]